MFVVCRAALLVTTVVVLGPCACGRIGFELRDVGGTRDGGSRADAEAGGATGATPEAGATGGSPGQTAEAGSPRPGDAAADSSVLGDAAPGDARADADGCVPVGPAPEYCSTIPALRAPPVIDGALDCGLSLRPLVAQGWTAPSPVPSEVSATYAVGYRPDGLYFYVVVVDPTRIPPIAGDEAWRGDGVELYVDADGVFTAPPDFDDPGTRQVEIAAPVDAVTPSARAQLYVWMGARSDWTSSNFIALPTSTGYVVEAFVGAAELGVSTWKLSPGARVGMDLAINVSDPTTSAYDANDGYRLGQYFLRVTTGSNPPPFSNVDAFCLPTLGP
ncbi:MAG TPA: sugar-binding protein [Polyangiaceae bacterium]|nr:sugar-binding protein [Polyangiaceae bacterium]